MKDCILFSLPYSDQIYSPSLGLGVLKGHAYNAGFNVNIIDLNIKYIDYLTKTTNSKNRKQCLEFALTHFKESLCLPNMPKHRIPCGLDELFGFNLSFSEIDKMLDDIICKSFWPSLLKKIIFDKYEQTPVIGLSIMGQPQVPFALLIGKLFKKYWPNTLVVAGGSHITLLKERIAEDAQYGKWIDLFLPGHCEKIFVDLLHSVKHKRDLPINGIIKFGSKFIEAKNLPINDVLPPLYDKDDIEQYNSDNMFFPVQIRRGCSYGKCRFCTYRVIEECDKGVSVNKISRKILTEISRWNPKRITVRDSLMDYRGSIEFGKACIDILPETIWRISSKINNNFCREKNIKLLHSLNCRVLEFGVETIHKHTQKLINKYHDVSMIEELFPIAASYGIKVQLNLMFGFPGETVEDCEKQLDWFFHWKNKYPSMLYGSFSMLDIIYGSIFASQSKQFGIKLQPLEPWTSIYIWNTPDWTKEFFKKLIVPENVVFNRSVHSELLYI